MLHCRASSGTCCAMAESVTGSRPGFVVLRDVGDGYWRLVAEADRRPGLSADAARAQAVLDATGGAATDDQRYAVVLRSEWRMAHRL
jgi:hypothetical protein